MCIFNNVYVRELLDTKMTKIDLYSLRILSLYISDKSNLLWYRYFSRERTTGLFHFTILFVSMLIQKIFYKKLYMETRYACIFTDS